jgi:hypothetical protein
VVVVFNLTIVYLYGWGKAIVPKRPKIYPVAHFCSSILLRTVSYSRSQAFIGEQTAPLLCFQEEFGFRRSQLRCAL